MNNYPKEILDQIKNNLEKEKTILEDRILELEKQDPFQDPERLNQNAASDGDAQEEFGHDRYQAMIDELKLQVELTNKALFRISDGSYGYCTKCHKMIDTDRLNLLPTAEYCLECQKNIK